MRSRRQSCGFTLIELAVSLAIMLILCSLLVVGVQAAREASRRTTCSSNCKQLAIALQSFEGAHKELPSIVGVRYEKAGSVTLGSLWYQMRSQLELPEIRRLVISGERPKRLPAQGLDHPAVLNCPSEPVVGGTSYRGNTGSLITAYRPTQLASDAGRFMGPFESPFPVRLEACIDGLSMTAFAAEKRKGAMDNAVSPDEVWGTGVDSNATNLDVDYWLRLGSVRPLTATNLVEYTGSSWSYTGYLFTSYNHVAGPNANAIQDLTGESATSLGPIQPLNHGVIKASSHHPGGVHVAFLDGSVRFVSETIDLSVWRATGTRANQD